jgi:hypothetical protein
VKGAKAGVCNFVQHFGNGLFAAHAESDVLRFPKKAESPDRGPHPGNGKSHKQHDSENEP